MFFHSPQILVDMLLVSFHGQVNLKKLQRKTAPYLKPNMKGFKNKLQRNYLLLTNPFSLIDSTIFMNARIHYLGAWTVILKQISVCVKFRFLPHGGGWE